MRYFLSKLSEKTSTGTLPDVHHLERLARVLVREDGREVELGRLDLDVELLADAGARELEHLRVGGHTDADLLRQLLGHGRDEGDLHNGRLLRLQHATGRRAHEAAVVLRLLLGLAAGLVGGDGGPFAREGLCVGEADRDDAR